MDIKAFIRELLFGHDCVIIPEFGGFIANFSPSRIDEQTGTFYPPLRKISFNRNLKHNDGLLIGKISQSTGVNYGDARRVVEEFVMNLNRKLAIGEKIIFDHIGFFINNNEYNLQFEPEKDANYLLNSFGLESFHCLPLKDYDVRKRIVRHLDRDPLKQSQVRKNIWRAAIVIPILAILVFVPLKTGIFKTKVETASLNPLVTAEFENNRKAVDEAVNITPDSSISVKSPAVIPIQPAPVVKEEQGKYIIITGSFKSEENARSHVNALKADGFDPEIIHASNGFFRVHAMRCSTIETAQNKRDSISKKFPGTWISKR